MRRIRSCEVKGEGLRNKETHTEKPLRCTVFSPTRRHTFLKPTQIFKRAIVILRKKVSLSHGVTEVFAQPWKDSVKLRLFYSLSCVGVNITPVHWSDFIHQTLTMVTEEQKCNRLSPGLRSNLRGA